MKPSSLLLVLATMFSGAIILGGCGKSAAPEAGTPATDIDSGRLAQPALTLVVGAVVSGSGNVYSGEIRARHETQLGFRIGGKIVERLVDAGARVRTGQILARLDPADSSLQASTARAQYQLAMEEAIRYRELRSRNFVSQAALDAKEAALKAAAAQTGLATNQIAYTVLRADHAGVIAATLAEVGQVVGAGQPVLRLAQDGEREVEIAIPETQFAKFRIGMPADVTLWSDDETRCAQASGETTSHSTRPSQDAGQVAGYGAGTSSPRLLPQSAGCASNVSEADKADKVHFKGRLRELSPAADPASRTYAARVALSGADTRAALGMTAQVRFKSNDKRDRLIVPLTAIFQQDDQAAVWIVAADDSISLRKVQVAAYRDDGAVIASGVTAGERIVSAGVHKLHAGEKIRIIEGEFASGNAE
jgi:multidrug efflux system membrane fusion protein